MDTTNKSITEKTKGKDKPKPIMDLGLKFRFSEKLYALRLSSRYVPPKPGSYIVVDTSRGVECGEVVNLPVVSKKNEKKDVHILKIIRQATAEDLAVLLKLPEEETNISKICINKFYEYGLPLKLIKTELVFDKKKVYFHYRLIEDSKKKKKVNLKDIAKDMNKIIDMKVEFVQVGTKGEAKVTGGLGNCGKTLCCTSWLQRPKHTSIKMAKEQSVPINIQKITGVCGRLECCLQYELEQYSNGKLIDEVAPRQTEDVEEYLKVFSE
ncbi:MAG: regulatory iron-sulfur-containing complex subunit RicT [Candidatus Margulisiibacteriota bacterium]